VRPKAKVTIDSLYEVICEGSIGTKMNDFYICIFAFLHFCKYW